MSNQADVVTSNLSLALPADQSHNTPWGADIQKITTAIQSVDSQIVAGIQSLQWVFAVDTGAANAYAAVFSPVPQAAPGTRVYVKCIHANTAASTLAITGFLAGAAKPITKNGTTALSGAEISANQIVQLVWDGTEWQMISQ
jgi:hypothetical protein